MDIYVYYFSASTETLFLSLFNFNPSFLWKHIHQQDPTLILTFYFNKMDERGVWREEDVADKEANYMKRNESV